MKTFAMYYGGLNVFSDVNMVDFGEPYPVLRTWVERLFTRPWTPLTKIKWVTPRIPMKKAWRHGNNVYMHPEMVKELENSLENLK